MPNLSDILDQEFGSAQTQGGVKPKKSISDIVGEEFSAFEAGSVDEDAAAFNVAQPPNIRPQQPWEFEESQRRISELQRRMATGAAGSASEDAVAFNENAPPEPAQLGYDQSNSWPRLEARKAQLKYTRAGRNLSDSALSALALKQITTEDETGSEADIERQRQVEGIYARAGEEARQNFRPELTSRPLQLDQQASQDFAGRMGFQAPSPDIIPEVNPITRQPMTPQDKALYDLALKQQSRGLALKQDAENYAQSEENARLDAALNVPGNSLPEVLRYPGRGLAKTGMAIGSLPIAAGDLVDYAKHAYTGEEADKPENMKYLNQVRGDMSRAAEIADADAASPAWARRMVEGGVQTLAQASLAGGGQAAAYLGGATTTAEGLGEAQEAGLTGVKALLYAAAQGAIETGSELVAQKMGAGGLETLLSGERKLAQGGLLAALKEVPKTILQENMTELPTSAAQEFAKTFMSEGKARGAQTLEEWKRVGLDTLAQTTFAGAAGHVSPIASAIAKKGPQAIRDAIEYGPVRGLETLAGINGRFSKKQREDAIRELERLAKEQPDLKEEYSNYDNDTPMAGFRRVGSEFADQLPEYKSKSAPDYDPQKEIQEHDSEVKKYTPQFRTPQNDLLESGYTDSEAARNAMASQLKKQGLYSDAEIARRVDAAFADAPDTSDTQLSPEVASKRLNQEQTVRQSDDPAQSGFNAEQAREDYFGEQSKKAIDEAAVEGLERAGIKQVAPEEAVRELQSEQFGRALEAEGVKPFTERRKEDRIPQKLWDQMSPEEQRKHHFTDRLTGLQNGEAYQEHARQNPDHEEGQLDAEGLKWFNDNVGKKAGDALLHAIGQHLNKKLSGTGVEVFRDEGDTFRTRNPKSLKKAKALIDSARRDLANAEIEIELPDGTRKVFKGVGAAFGYGKNEQDADTAMLADKKESIERGERGERGTKPPRLVEVDPQGKQGSVREVPGARGAGVGQEGIPGAKTEAGVQPEGSGKAVERKARSVTPEHVSKAFPGAKVSESAKGYSVELPSGKKLEVEFGEVRVNKRQAVREFKAKHGRAPTDNELAQIKGLGGYRNGKITLPEDASEKDVVHESLHAVYDDISDADKKVLTQQYAKAGMSKAAIEESIAKAREAWDGGTSTPGGKIFAKYFGEPESKGKPELASPVSGDKGRTVVAGTDQAAKEEGKPETRSRDVERSRAAADFKKDPAAAYKLIRDMADDHSPSEYEVNLGKLVAQDAMDKAGNDPEKLAEAAELITKWRTGGTEAGRAFAARSDAEMKPLQRKRWHLQNLVYMPYGKYAEEIAKAKTPDGKKVAMKRWATRLGEIKNSLSLEGIQLDKELTEEQMRKAAGLAYRAQSDSSTYGDVLQEYFRNSILSGPRTLVVNMVGNSVSVAKHYLADRVVESSIHAMQKSGLNPIKALGITAKEYGYIVRGMWGATGKAWANAVKTWDTEIPTVDNENNSTEGQKPAIKGKLGRVIRAPQRFNSAADDFFKTLIVNAEVGAEAYKSGLDKGLKGEALEKHISEQTQDHESDAWQKATERAVDLTFGKKRKVLSKVIEVRNASIAGVKPLTFIFPFVTTPFNVTVEAFKSTPIGLLSVAKKMYENREAGKQIMDGTSTSAAKAIVGTAALAALASAIGDDDEWITGANETTFDPSSPSKGGFVRMSRPPTSIRIGDKWYSYGRIEPVGTALGMIVDAIRGKKKNGSLGMASEGVRSVASQLENKTFLKSLFDLTEIHARGYEKEGVRKFAQNVAIGFVPNAFRAPMRATEESVPQTKAWGSGYMDPKYREMAKDRLVQAAQFADGENQFDVWGRKVGQNPEPSPKSDFLLKLLSPVDVQKAQATDPDIALLRYNQTADKEWYPSKPDPDYKDGQTTKYMNREQYAKFSEESGKEFRKYMENFVKNSGGKLNDAQIKRIGEKLSDIRKAWRTRVVRAE